MSLFHKNKALEGEEGATTQSSAEPQQETGRLPVEAVRNVLTRSSDVIATLRDICVGGTSEPSYNTLVTLLSHTDVVMWFSAPRVTANRLARNGHLWFNSRFEDLDDDSYDRIIGIEGAANLGCDLADRGMSNAGWEAIISDARWILGQTQDLQVAPLQTPSYMDQVYANVASSAGEWACRMGISEFAEDAATAFRVVFDVRANMNIGTALISLELPRPACFAFCADTQELRSAIARDYGVRLMLLMAKGAYATNQKLSRVVVTGHGRGNPKPILSLDINREQVEPLLASVRGASVDEVLAGNLCKARSEIASDGWFLPISPHLSATDPLMLPAYYTQRTELSSAFCSERLSAVSGAAKVKDFGINENASRQQKWDEIGQYMEFAERASAITESAGAFSAEFKHFDSTLSDKLVFGLITLRNQTEDMKVERACGRTIKALMEERIAPDDTEALRNMFVRGEGLASAVDLGYAAYAEHDGEKLFEAIAALEEALTPEMQIAYLDDTEAVYRYFSNVAERVYFNVTLHDHVRDVVLVPDEYYQAHMLLARIYNLLGQGEEALAHCDEIIRIAPASPDAALVKVRVLETQSRLFEAIDLLNRTIQICATARDAAICHYRMAYLQWKMGRNDLSMACYRRSISFTTLISGQAKVELEELYAMDLSLGPYRDVPDEQVFALLDEAGIARGCDQQVMERTIATAVLCADEGLFSVASPMTAVYSDMRRDDVIFDMYHSFAKPEEFSIR